MKYFLHDTNSFSDEKITELFIAHGYEGVGLFYTILERIAMQEKPIKTSVLKTQLHVGRKLEKCWSFMENIGLISSSNDETFNERILSYSQKYQIQKEKTAEKVKQWRERHAVEKNVTGYVPVSNHPKVKLSKVKERKEEKERRFAPPVLNEVIEYFTENNYSEQSAKKAFQYYESNQWKDSSGKQVLNWKQKMISVWFKDEHKINGKQMVD